MSEVVPLPSFGEVFFDERGQERVLRVTWHEGTLVLSLWRGEMCTASFRMPMNDVGRLVDTLDEGFIEAGGQYPDEVDEPVRPEQPPHGEPQAYGEYPGTGQYARPRPEDYAQPQQYADPAGHVAEPGDSRPAPALGPNDVLVARGVTPAPDRTPPGYGPSDVVPRENLIVNDALPYGQPQPVEPPGADPAPGEAGYQLPGDRYPNAQQPGPYGAPQPDAYPGSGRQPEPYGGAPRQEAYPGPVPQADFYGAPAQQPGYGAPQPDAYPGGRQPEPYGAPRSDPYDASPQPRQVDPFAAPSDRQRPAGPVGPVDPFAPPADRFPGHARPVEPDPYAQTQQNSTDPFGFAAQQAAQEAAQGAPYGYPSPAQPDPYVPDPYAPGAQQPHQAGHPADLRDLYSSPPAYPQQDVDPSDPLGLFGRSTPDQRLPRPYVQETPHSTGDRLRPEQHHEEQHPDQRFEEPRYEDGRHEGRRRGDRGDRGDRQDW
ncbi:hypothetical protein [Streptosporangium sp. NPDC023615]|uniref:hypothetical protein n=1 Tax=Streptosporangium sp. NPDC023615 TaxID=3154794 RepID=UPI00341F38C5